jgi:hypothetical protein
MKYRFPVSLAVILFCTGCGPIGPMPGLNIGGTQQPAPESFEFAQDHELLTIRTLLGGWLPQVHNIWGVGVGDAVYAMAVPEASWRARLEDDPEVLIRIGDNVYRLTATVVDDADEIQAAFDAYVAKYGDQLEAIVGHPPTVADVTGLIRFSAG